MQDSQDFDAASALGLEDHMAAMLVAADVCPHILRLAADAWIIGDELKSLFQFIAVA